MPPQPNLRTLYTELIRSFTAQPCDLEKCGFLLSQLKIGLIEAGLLLPQDEPNPTDLQVARDILEIGAFCSIRARDVPSFDRYFSQLQTFYTDFNSVLPPSKREYAIRGLHLIRLLTQNRIAEFHTTLESLPFSADVIAKKSFISHPVNLEQWLMEGSYSKVWNARETAPAEEYKFFIDSLMDTIRNEIASCSEAAYERLPLKDAATLLFFPNRSDLLRFAEERGWQVNVTEATISFAKKGEEKVEIPKQKFISTFLVYAQELEQIV